MSRRPIPRFVWLATAVNASLSLLWALILHLHRKNHFTPHANGVAVYHRNFADLLDFTAQFRFFHQAAFFHQPSVFLQPPPLAVAYRIVFLFGSHALTAFCATLVLGFLVADLLFMRCLIRRGVATMPAAGLAALTLLFAWPVWFDLKQGNLECILWIALATGVYAFFHRRPFAAAACFALAASMKIYPLLYLGLLLARKQYRAFFFGLGVAAATLLLSLWLVCPDMSESWHGMLTGLGLFHSNFILAYQSAEGGLDHSLFSLVKLLLAALGRFGLLQNPAFMSHLTATYFAVVAISGIALWIVRIRHLPAVNQLLALTVAAILLPPVSFEYTLMHLYLPWSLLVLVAIQTDGQNREERPSALPAGLLPVFLLLAVLVSPLTELMHHGWGLAGECKAVLLLLLFLLALKYPFPSSADVVSASFAPPSSIC